MTGEIEVGFKPQTRIIMDDTETMTTEEKPIISSFKELFKCIFNRPTVGYNLDLNMDYYITEIDIMVPKNKEIENLIMRLKNNRAPGENSIVTVLFKKGGTY